MKTILALLALVTLMSVSVQAADLGQRESDCIYTKANLSRVAAQNLDKGSNGKQRRRGKNTMSK